MVKIALSLLCDHDTSLPSTGRRDFGLTRDCYTLHHLQACLQRLYASIVVGRCMGGICTDGRRCFPSMGLDSYFETFTRLDFRIGLRLRRLSRAARMSIIFSIIRISNLYGDKVHKRITYLIAVSFMCMWAALVAYKISVCIRYSCQMTQTAVYSQLTTNVVADVTLIVTPLLFWRNARISRNSKILILSAFSSSILITIITIPRSMMLFQAITETALIMSYVKAALSLVVCNVLVIVTLVYRVFWKEILDLDQSLTSPGLFTTVIVTQFPVSTNSGTLPSVQEDTNQDK